MRVTLLRSSVSPDETADRGRHRFSCAIYPHAGNWAEADVPTMSENFANPATAIAGISASDTTPLTVEDLDPARKNHFVVDVIKLAEDGCGVILRGNETKGSRGRVRPRIDFMDVAEAFRTDLLESRIDEPIGLSDTGLELPYRPYEIITIGLLHSGQNRASGHSPKLS